MIIRLLPHLLVVEVVWKLGVGLVKAGFTRRASYSCIINDPIFWGPEPEGPKGGKSLLILIFYYRISLSDKLSR